jgi:LacI family transcriptional regulator
VGGGSIPRANDCARRCRLRPTIREIAAAAKVNVSTVSRVLSGRAEAARIGAKTAKRVLAEARRLGYQPNLAARALRTRRSHALGLVVTDLANSFFATIAAAAEAEAREAGYAVLIAGSGEDQKRQAGYIAELRSRTADGLIIAPAPGAAVRRELRTLAAASYPLVTIDRLVKGLDCDRVVSSSRDGAAQLVAVLAAMGCRRLAMAGGPEDVWTAAERLAGFRQGLERAGLAADEDLVACGEFSSAQGRSAAERFLALSSPPDGIVAANNRILEGVLDALTVAGEAAKSVAVAGFDGVPYAPFLSRPVAVAEQPAEEIGRCAARLLVERIEGRAGEPREVVLPVRLRTFTPAPGAAGGRA